MNKPKLTMIELFSGIGAQKRGIDNTGLYDLEVVATSDIDKEAVVEYAAIHHQLTDELIENYKGYPTRECMIQDLKDRNIGMDFDKGKMYDWDKLLKKKTKDIEKYWLAMTLQNNLGDISKIELLPEADCWFYSSPCQCFSLAGKQDGIDATCNECGKKYNPMLLDVDKRYICPYCGSDDIKGTRSGLLLEVERLLVNAIENGTQPKYLCLENVKNLVGKQFKPDFDAWLKRLEHLGYNTYWKVLNAKSCGIPQNRERVFAFSIRKDIDTGKFTFPIPFDNGLRLKDVLEKNVDEKYYINTERASNLIQQLVDKGQLKGQRVCCDMSDNNPNTREIANCIVQRYDKGISAMRQEGTAVAEPQTDLQPILVKNMGTEYVKDLDESVTLKARDWKGWDNYGSTAVVESEKLDTSKRLGGLWDGETRHQAGSVWDTNGMSPTLDTAQGGGRMPHIAEHTEPKERFFKQAIDTFNNNSCKEGDTIDAFNQRVNKSGYCPTITTRPEGFKTAILPVVKEDIDTSKPICVGNTTPSGKSQCNAVYSTEGVSQTLCAGTHGYSTGTIVEEQQKEQLIVNIGNSSRYRINNFGEVFDNQNGIHKLEEIDGYVELKVGGELRKVFVESLMNKYFPQFLSEYQESKKPEVIGIKQATKKGYIECELPGVADLSFPNSKTRRGRVESNGQIVPTLTAAEGGIRYIESIYRIRKLTPRETSRLMGFTFEDCDKCAAIGISNSALYKAHGNSIVCDCIQLLFEHLYKAQYDESYICTDEKMQKA